MDTTMEEEHERAAKDGTLGQFPIDKLMARFSRDRVERAEQALASTCSTTDSPSPTARAPETVGMILDALPPISTTGQPTSPSPSGRSVTLVPSSGAGAVARPIDLAPVREAFRSQDADKLESALYRSLKPLQTSLRCLTDANFEVVGYELAGPIAAGTMETLRPLAEAITAPVGHREAVALVTRMLMVTKSREPDGVDLRGMIAILSEELAEFPADVVATACRKWARREKWWPSLSEIRWECQKANRWRESFAKAVRG